MHQERKRLAWIDELRGLAVLAMILYHIAFNLLYFLELDSPWLSSVMESRSLSVLHTLFAGVFLGLSGICCHFTRRPLWRSVRVALCAAAVTIVTYMLFPEETIWFGVLHCLAVCMLLFWALGRYLTKIPPAFGLGLCLMLFVLTFRIPMGYLLAFPLPGALYVGGILTPLGLPDIFFQSLDYVPLVPNIFLFAGGFFLGRMPLPAGRTHSAFCAFCGRHSLLIYLTHQPVVFGIFFLISRWCQ